MQPVDAIVIDLSEGSSPVQSAGATHGKASDTELARVIANQSGWRLAPGGELLDADEQFIVATITLAAEGMRDLGWFTQEHLASIDWDAVPGSRQRSTDLRRWLDAHGAGQDVRYVWPAPTELLETPEGLLNRFWFLPAVAVVVGHAAVTFLASINLSVMISTWTMASSDVPPGGLADPCPACMVWGATPSPGGWMIWTLVMLSSAVGYFGLKLTLSRASRGT